jgi:hypothetical protein
MLGSRGRGGRGEKVEPGAVRDRSRGEVIECCKIIEVKIEEISRYKGFKYIVFSSFMLGRTE